MRFSTHTMTHTLAQRRAPWGRLWFTHSTLTHPYTPQKPDTQIRRPTGLQRTMSIGCHTKLAHSVSMAADVGSTPAPAASFIQVRRWAVSALW